MKTAPGTASNATRDALRSAFYKRGILEADKQYRFAENLGFDLSPSEGYVTVLPSFLNLSEVDAQRLLLAVENDQS